MAEVTGRWVQSQVTPCGILGGGIASGIGFFLRVLRFPPLSIIQSALQLTASFNKTLKRSSGGRGG